MKFLQVRRAAVSAHKPSGRSGRRTHEYGAAILIGVRVEPIDWRFEINRFSPQYPGARYGLHA